MTNRHDINNGNHCDCDEDNTCGCSYPNNIAFPCGCTIEDNCGCIKLDEKTGKYYHDDSVCHCNTKGDCNCHKA